MAKYTGRQATVVVDGTTINTKDVTIARKATMEDSVDTASATMTVGSDVLVIEEQEPVAISLEVTVTAFHLTTQAIHSVVSAGKSVTVTVNEKSGKSWGCTGRIPEDSIKLAPKKLTEFTFSFRATSAWTIPTS